MTKKKILFLTAPTLILFMVMSGCTRLHTTRSVFEIQDNRFQTVEAAVDSAFNESGYSREDKLGQRKQYYSILGEKNRFGVPVRYTFKVVYETLQGNVVVHVKNQKLGASESEATKIKEHLSAVTVLIDRKLKEADLSAAIETKAYWLPALGELP